DRGVSDDVPRPLVPAPVGRVSEPSRWLLAAWLSRHEGPEAAAAWWGAPFSADRSGLRAALSRPLNAAASRAKEDPKP
ncbi:MAG: hypothetical protein AAGA56_05635, partial [Myxococcota bacterium]